MDENRISCVKRLLYSTDNNEVINYLSQTDDSEILYVYAYNYNWDNGFDIPRAILDNAKSDLSIALLLFYRADGIRYLEDKSENKYLPCWFSFIKSLYDSIVTRKYQIGEIGFKVPLSNVHLYKLKKMITEGEFIFLENIEGKCLDVDL